MSTALPRAERAPRSFWFDPRFAIGIGLVLVAVIGVVTIVSATDTTVQVYSARAALSPGDRIQISDLDSRPVRLGQVEGKYLLSGHVPAKGLVVIRAVSAGELIPASATGALAGVTVASIVVTVAGELPQSITAGSVVDLWSARETEANVFGPPTVLVSSVTVVRVVKQEGIIASRGGHSVELLIPRTRTAAVLEAIANSDSISLVSTSIPTRN